MNGPSTAQRGSVVLVALCLTVVLGVVVIGYVAVCARTMEMSNRSFCTTSSVQLAEIGMEEALWSLDQALLALNSNSSYDWPGAQWTITTDANGVKTATKILPPFVTNKGITGTVTVQIKNCSYDPRIPYDTNNSKTWPPTITSDGMSQMPDGISIDKQLVATVKPAALFSNAVGSTGSSDSISFANASGGIVDSYDSNPLTAPNAGIYTPPPLIINRSDRAIISGSHLTIKNAVILGYATTANSTNDTPFIDSYGSVTSIDSTTGLPSSVRIDNSRISNNANQYAFEIITPTMTGYVNGGQLFNGAATGSDSIGSLGVTTFYYSGSSGIALAGSDILTIDGPVIISISHDFSISDSAKIVVTANGSAQIYVAGNLDIEGLGIDNTLTRQPRKLAIFCTKVSGNAILNWNAPDANPFYGAVYVPSSPLSVGSGSMPNYDMTIHGALVGQSVTFNDTPTIHYDLDLRKATFSVVNTPYDVSQWLVSN